MRHVALALLLLVAPLAGCADADPEPADVVATFYPLAWVSERLAGPDLTVGTLVPAGVEPHDWEPVPGDVARLGDAKLVVAQGAGFEPWLDGLLGNLGERRPTLVDTTQALPLRDAEEHEGEEEGHEGAEAAYDPHTWLDPTLLARQARAIEDAMASAFPEQAEGIRARGVALQDELARLDADMMAALDACEVDVIVANHDAYGYMAARYGFHVEAISGLSPEAEPSPEDLSRVIEVAREHNLTIVFFEELVSPRVAQVVADEVGAQTRVLSPVESASEGHDYATLMRQNMVHLQEAMRCT